MFLYRNYVSYIFFISNKMGWITSCILSYINNQLQGCSCFGQWSGEPSTNQPFWHYSPPLKSPKFTSFVTNSSQNCNVVTENNKVCKFYIKCHPALKCAGYQPWIVQHSYLPRVNQSQRACILIVRVTHSPQAHCSIPTCSNNNKLKDINKMTLSLMSYSNLANI